MTFIEFEGEVFRVDLITNITKLLASGVFDVYRWGVYNGDHCLYEFCGEEEEAIQKRNEFKELLKSVAKFI